MHCCVRWGDGLWCGSLNHVEPENTEAALSHMQLEGRLYRRRAKHRGIAATLFGTVDVWRRLYEPLERGIHAIGVHGHIHDLWLDLR